MYKLFSFSFRHLIAICLSHLFLLHHLEIWSLSLLLQIISTLLLSYVREIEKKTAHKLHQQSASAKVHKKKKVPRFTCSWCETQHTLTLLITQGRDLKTWEEGRSHRKRKSAREGGRERGTDRGTEAEHTTESVCNIDPVAYRSVAVPGAFGCLQ